MVKYRIVHSTAYQYSEPVPVCHNQIRLAPRDTSWTQCTSHRLLIRPTPPGVSRRKDWFGNIVQGFSLEENHRKLTVTSSSRVTVSPQTVPAVDQTPTWESVVRGVREQSIDGALAAVEFVCDSPHVTSDDMFRDFVSATFQPGRPVLEAAVALTSKIFTEFRYDPKATTVTTRPGEVLEAKHGVCQDFAHVAIACLRSLGVPARYVSGYLRTIPPPGKARLIGVDASHAWFSVWCGPHGWIDLDPTNDCVCGTDHVPIAWGRDYSDVAPVRGVFVGGGQHTLKVQVDVEPVG